MCQRRLRGLRGAVPAPGRVLCAAGGCGGQNQPGWALWAPEAPSCRAFGDLRSPAPAFPAAPSHLCSDSASRGCLKLAFLGGLSDQAPSEAEAPDTPLARWDGGKFAGAPGAAEGCGEEQLLSGRQGRECRGARRRLRVSNPPGTVLPAEPGQGHAARVTALAPRPPLWGCWGGGWGAAFPYSEAKLLHPQR